MRLICTITPSSADETPFGFAQYLASQGIENQCEEVMIEGKLAYNIWIYDEDLVQKAMDHYVIYNEKPQDPIYQVYSENIDSQSPSEEPPALVNKKKRSLLSPAPYGPISLIMIFAVICIFILSHLQNRNFSPPTVAGVAQAPILSPIERTLIFDYPEYFAIRDKLLTLYTAEDIEKKLPPSEQAQALINQLKQTSVWMGVYDPLVEYIKNPQQNLSHYKGAIATDIKQGQLWRLFTPALLHLDFLHIFFNLLWFILLGNQIEYRIGSWRYLLMIVVIAIIANVGQYLVSGPFFMGLSAVVCGMAAFIWARQQVAPWEGYLLQRLTLIFLAIFVLGMFALQLLFFFLQIFGKMNFTIGIANTAHLLGAGVGYSLGRLRRFFAIHKKMRPQ